MTIRDKTCCFTGHRDIPQAQIPVLKKSDGHYPDAGRAGDHLLWCGWGSRL